ncbi:hypothetical protein [Burkholderia seminalis]|uniref:hypothetical protein n=1 Tax=Burkholderia seminalis TaxID=488731 RepID=UPI002653F6BC|nr:hypothetical protein [Burkholderia seminalis]MDN7585654.1 hypothetical protein [Burkholderia seminalis]
MNVGAAVIGVMLQTGGVGTLSPYYPNLASGAFLLLAVIPQTLLTGRASHPGVAPLQTGTLNACLA